MFHEVKATSQLPDQPHRRWFSGTNMDIFVWLGDDHEIISYQITYDKPHAEKALTWSKDKGFRHHAVDDGENPGKYPGTPLLVADGALNIPRIIYLLNKNLAELEPDINQFIAKGIIQKFG